MNAFWFVPEGIFITGLTRFTGFAGFTGLIGLRGLTGFAGWRINVRRIKGKG